MNTHSVSHSLHKLMLAGIALAGLGSAMVFTTTGPAEAKRMTCLQKYHGCQARCVRRYDDNFLPCIYRTCNIQFDNCSGAKFSAGTMRPKDAAATGPQKPADKTGKKPSSGAEHAGKKNGGFGQRGPMFMSRSRR